EQSNMLLVNQVAETKHSRLQRMTDAKLVSSAARGNREAYRVLVERYQNKAVSIALQILKSREDAEDVAQEAFVKAYTNLKGFKGQSSFSTWLYRIVYTTAIDLKRRLGRRGGETREFNEGMIADTSNSVVANRFQNPAQEVLQREALKLLQQALN